MRGGAAFSSPERGGGPPPKAVVVGPVLRPRLGASTMLRMVPLPVPGRR
jgi:hypothetical protein